MRRVLVAVAVVAAALAPRPAAPAAPPDPLAGIQELLDRRAEAMRRGDEQAFMATVDRSDPRFVRRQRALFRGFQEVGVGRYSLAVGEGFWPELTTGREVARYGSAARPTVLHVEERSTIGGFDLQPALEDLFLTFVRRPGGWKVASDADLDDVSLRSGRKLWELGPIVTRRSEHFLLVSHPDLRSAAPAILEAAESALDDVDEAWPFEWHRRVVILAPSDPDELRRIIQATFDLDVFVAFAYSAIDRTHDWDLLGHRIILNWDNFSRAPGLAQQRILTHELLHIATRELSGPMTPAFLDEGVADWVAGDISDSLLAQRVEDGRFDGRLPRDFEFFTGEDHDVLGAYQESVSAVRFAVTRFGFDDVADFYSILGRVRLAAGTSRYHVDRAMRAAFGVGFPEFERRWASWLEMTL